MIRSNLEPRLREAPAPLPASSYVDPAVFERERHAWARWPAFAGHESLVPRAGDFVALDGRNGDLALVRAADGPHLLSNVCRHRQARLLEGAGSAATSSTITCPLHGWTYDLAGKLLGAPGFDPPPDGCSLAQHPVLPWRGLLLRETPGLAQALHDFPAGAELEWSGFRHQRTVVDELPCNWKDFVDVYLEIYHVGFAHPGLRNWVDVQTCEWRFGRGWSMQSLAPLGDWTRQESPRYAAYRDAALAASGGRLPALGVVWAMIYPDIMLEVYPGALVVSTLQAIEPGRTRNIIDFYHPEEVLAFDPGLAHAHQDAYLETADEDRELCRRLHEGRRSLWENDREDPGPFHPHQEDGILHFHDWWSSQLSRQGAGPRSATAGFP